MSAAHFPVVVSPWDNIRAKRRQPVWLQELTAIELVCYCLQSGEHAAWQEFVRRFQPAIAAIVIKAVRHWARPEPSLVDDLVQETYLKLFADDFRPLRRFTCKHESAFFGFLKVVASNVVQDHYRSSYCQKRGNGKPEDELENVTLELATNDASCAAAMEQQILISQIEDCLKTHSTGPHFTRNYLIFQLYYRLGLTTEAISRLPQIGLTAKGVESTLARLLRGIKTTMRYSRC